MDAQAKPFPRSVKVHLSGSETRRFPVEAVPATADGRRSLAGFCAAVRDQFFPEVKGKQFAIQYFDDEGDHVTLSSQQELDEAFDIAQRQQRACLSFNVTVVEPDNERRFSLAAASATAPARVVHHRVRCDKCQVCPIVGVRYTCAVRKDYDLCEACEQRDDSPFPYLKIKIPAQSPAAIMCVLRENASEVDADTSQAQLLEPFLQRVEELQRATGGVVGQPSVAAEPAEPEQPQPEPAHDDTVVADGAETKQADADTPVPALDESQGPGACGGGGGGGSVLVAAEPAGDVGEFGSAPLDMRRMSMDQMGAMLHEQCGLDKSHVAELSRWHRTRILASMGSTVNPPPPDELDTDAEEVRAAVAAGEAAEAVAAAEAEAAKEAAAAAAAASESVVLEPPPAPTVTANQQPSFPVPINATFVSDVTVPDETVFAPGEQFNKVWLVKNDGAVAWPAGCRVTFQHGTNLTDATAAAAATAPLPALAGGGSTAVMVAMQAPAQPGLYSSFWLLEPPDLTTRGPHVWLWCKIKVEAPPAPVVALPSPPPPASPSTSPSPSVSVESDWAVVSSESKPDDAQPQPEPQPAPAVDRDQSTCSSLQGSLAALTASLTQEEQQPAAPAEPEFAPLPSPSGRVFSAANPFAGEPDLPDPPAPPAPAPAPAPTATQPAKVSTAEAAVPPALGTNNDFDDKVAKWAQAINRLVEMGFADVNRNLAALEKHCTVDDWNAGDKFQLVVQDLLAA